LNALASLETINKQLSTHQARLASGKRINSASDDPAGLTIATKLQARSEGLKVALNNISDGKNLLAVAESGLGRINDIIVQMRNKVEQAASDTVGVSEREAILAQLRAYSAQVDDIVTQTEWNGNKLIDGSYDSNKMTFQTGAGISDTTQVDGLKDMRATGGLALAFKATANSGSVADAGLNNGQTTIDHITLNAATSLTTGLYQVRFTVSDTSTSTGTAELLNSAGTVIQSVTGASVAGTVNFNSTSASISVTLGTASGTGTYNGVIGYTKSGDYDLKTSGCTGTYMSTASQFNSFLSTVESKLNAVSSQLARIGAFTGRLEFKEEQVSAAQINIEASYSRIMNANMAEEQVNASKLLILQQTATSMLSQANQAPQFLLSLFR
jgi:flagellin